MDNEVRQAFNVPGAHPIAQRTKRNKHTSNNHRNKRQNTSLFFDIPPEEIEEYQRYISPNKIGGGYSMTRRPFTLPSSTSSSISNSFIATPGSILPSYLDSCRYFFWDYSDDYFQMINTIFVAIKDMQNPQEVFAFHISKPYCMEGALLLYKYYKSMNSMVEAYDILSKIIYSISVSFHPSFVPWDVPCRLSFTTENHMDIFYSSSSTIDRNSTIPSCTFYELFYEFMIYTGTRFRYRTAWEIGKWLLSLQPTGKEADPLRLLLSLDQYALLSKQYEWIVEFTGLVPKTEKLPIDSNVASARILSSSSSSSLTNSTPSSFIITLRDTNIPLVMLPNWSLTRSIALFNLELQGKRIIASTGTRKNENTMSIPQESSSSLYTDTSFTSFSATRMLLRTLLMFPPLLSMLLEVLHITPETKGIPPSILALDRIDQLQEQQNEQQQQQLPPDLPVETNTYPNPNNHPHMTPINQCVWSTVLQHRLFALPKPRLSILENFPINNLVLNKFFSIYTHVLQETSSACYTSKVLRWIYYTATLACQLYDTTDQWTQSIQNNPSVIDDKNFINQTFDTTVLSLFDHNPMFAIGEVHTSILCREQVYWDLQINDNNNPCDRTNIIKVIQYYADCKVQDFIHMNEGRNIQRPGNPPVPIPNNRDNVHDDEDIDNPDSSNRLHPYLPRSRTLQLQQSNPILLFLQSFLPWYKLPGYQHDETRPWQGL